MEEELWLPWMPMVLPRTEGTYHLQGQLSGREGQSTAAMVDSRQTCTQEGYGTQAQDTWPGSHPVPGRLALGWS